MNFTIVTTFVAFIGEVLGTITGLGNATFFVPIMSFFTSFDHVLGIVAFIHVFSNITRISFFWKNIDIKVFLQFGISNIVFVAVGAFFTKYVGVNFIEILLGTLLMVFSFYELVYKNIRLPQSSFFQGFSGAIAGFFGGLVGTSGPFRTIILINIGLTKEAYIATSVAVDFIGDVLRLGIYIFNGFVDTNVLSILPWVFIASLLGALIGQRILSHLPIKLFNKLIIGTLFILGSQLIIKNIEFLL